ncbi:hypothetical protein GIB67_034431 [Kingdonia uniflora]|uniref:Uncharacterized protein n=1 Tax=Kingdonia uniflora TaxID=39325 RepID=A0A7J7PAW1_9MAGN|nr:hypothetical protein GIB67_034431 [Kingdonia uniflora]
MNEECTGVTRKRAHHFRWDYRYPRQVVRRRCQVCRETGIPIMSGEKALYSRMQCISKGAILGSTAHTFIRRLKAAEQYPEEKVDSRVRMKVQSPRTSVGKARRLWFSRKDHSCQH